MDAVIKKAMSITRIGFIMFQYFHSVSSGSGLSYLCYSANNPILVILIAFLITASITYPRKYP
jgi:hypothetical protein